MRQSFTYYVVFRDMLFQSLRKKAALGVDDI